MAKKKSKEENDVAKSDFDVITALADIAMPEYFKRAFLITYDITKIKNEKDLEKAIKEYGEMK